MEIKMSDYNHPVDLKVIEKLKEPFEGKQEKKRKGPWDKSTNSHKYFKYIPVDIIQERLDNVLGTNWNWEILSVETTSFRKKTGGYKDRKTGNYIEENIIDLPASSVTGRLTITFPSGKIVSRDGIGGATIDKGLDGGDAQKIAASNALKKAASLFGVGAYLSLEGNDTMDDTSMFPNNNFKMTLTAGEQQPTPIPTNNNQSTMVTNPTPFSNTTSDGSNGNSNKITFI